MSLILTSDINNNFYLQCPRSDNTKIAVWISEIILLILCEQLQIKINPYTVKIGRESRMFELEFHQCHNLDRCLRTHESAFKECQVYNDNVKTMYRY